MNRSSAVLAFALLLPTISLVAEDQIPEPGPENNGLRLRLNVENDADKPDHHTIKVEILNVSDKPITIQDVDNDISGNFTKYLQGRTTFDVYPRVVSSGFSIFSGKEHLREMKIDAGKSLQAKWEVTGRCLSAHSSQWKVEFPTIGRFDVRAQIMLNIKDESAPKPDLAKIAEADDHLPPPDFGLPNEPAEKGKDGDVALGFLAGNVLKSQWPKTHLWSNAQPIIVGGSNKAPKLCTARVLMADAEKGTVILDGVGTFNDVKPGDHFRIDRPGRGSFELEIVECFNNRANAKVVKSEFVDKNDATRFPEPDMVAKLVPEK